VIRDKIFRALRRLVPAKLERRGRGDLISLITSDVELLEVFYAHTISPILLAALFGIVLIVWLGTWHILLGVYAAACYLVLGVVMPLLTARHTKDGDALREEVGALGSFLMDSLRGVGECIQYGCGQRRMEELDERTARLGEMQRKLNQKTARAGAAGALAVHICTLGMLALAVWLYVSGALGVDGMLLPVLALAGSFGPVLALNSLGSGLTQTVAAGRRVLDLLDETPQTAEVTAGGHPDFVGMKCKNVGFTYDAEPVLEKVSLEIPKCEIIGLCGSSGSGKSTLLRLLMRFWDVSEGEITLSGIDLREINTAHLRNCQSLVGQETVLFNESILENVRIARLDATEEEIVEACKKASIHDFIQTLPDGYNSIVGELGGRLSGGERQRIGLARAFLHDAPLMLLDEPTSNLDSLNEGVILKALAEEHGKRTVVLVSHRLSTLGIAGRLYTLRSGRMT
jgi:ATP-binding cassette subfamily C protein